MACFVLFSRKYEALSCPRRSSRRRIFEYGARIENLAGRGAVRGGWKESLFASLTPSPFVNLLANSLAISLRVCLSLAVSVRQLTLTWRKNNAKNEGWGRGNRGIFLRENFQHTLDEKKERASGEVRRRKT